MIIIYIISFFLILFFLGFISIIVGKKIDFSLDYYNANRESVNLAPKPHTTQDAIIHVYAARAFNWRGIFAVHTWIAFKYQNAPHYEVLQVVGWRKYRGLPPLLKETDIPDRAWYGQKPKIILEIRGKKAEKLIPKIMKASDEYPYQGYQIWPGPNSNTFTALVGRKVKELGLTMPANAIGKDYLGSYQFFSRAPSGTGYQISLWGIFGILVAFHEGFEINFLSFIFGISPRYLVVKIPCVGDFGLFKMQ